MAKVWVIKKSGSVLRAQKPCRLSTKQSVVKEELIKNIF
ncbi:hypothetical protein N499_0823 [Wolbachia pipientis wVitA]|nr:hypothetical protein N500_1062 [Wolbachia pipientis wUni]ONI57500.1 hypothetical protein N499_0823 [Wolbachia pipientis wVitA]